MKIVMSYRESHASFAAGRARAYVNGYPFSALAIGVALGVVGAVSFGNLTRGWGWRCSGDTSRSLVLEARWPRSSVG